MNLISRIGFGLGVIALLMGCAAQPPSIPSYSSEASIPAEVVRYQKTMCFGPCPAFVFEVGADGACALELTRPFREGNLAKLEPGLYVAQLERLNDWNASIAQAYEQTGYSDLAPSYDNPRITDLPATITTIRGYQVENRYKGPDLATLYAVLDTTMANLPWQPIETKNK
jgi:hypothetical protein